MTIFRIWESFGEARGWFRLALIFGGLFLAVSALYALGALDMPTLLVERWLLARPLMQVDCVLVEWRNFGSPYITLGLFTAVGALCILAHRYRWPILPYLLLLILFSAFIETLGKQFIGTPLPFTMQSALAELSCPQRGHGLSAQLPLFLGMWWRAPLPAPTAQAFVQRVAHLPIRLTPGSFEDFYGYPSGHAIRWCFTGIVLAWLCWRHMRPAVLRRPLAVVLLVLCYLGAAIHFYIGAHLFPDTLAGDLLGTSLGCLAIGLFVLSDTQRRSAQKATAAPGVAFDGAACEKKTSSAMLFARHREV
jgi:hypothetical protein